MGNDEMKDVAKFYARVLLNNEDPKKVKQDVHEFKSNYHVIRIALMMKIYLAIHCDTDAINRRFKST